MDILKDLGYLIRIHTNHNDGVTEIQYEASTDGKIWKSFDAFIKEDVDMSYHELVRKNVVAVTRYNIITVNNIYIPNFTQGTSTKG